ncbi:group II intron reverse transcriptase/maturase [Priestia aryabhattai]|uniref:Group II intron reverse transcriptase/maturase n=1 Tax=Priestia aryabhattai TaxID=412384 RepID=A0ABD5L294_PRIAR|nr:group II intron reverse transcriptase/maturase [Priestia aryabhattai]MCM2978679.1 group II intron reverse transcriptase/maturase [Priestia aryabhattai]NGY89615.1 group II intron reverse transcriptase/maturase [Priestia megaterium]
MRSPAIVLDNLIKHAGNPNYQFQRLYRNLYNVDFYLDAYNKIYANEGNMTSGVDGKTIDGMSLERINSLIESLKNHTYKPTPVKRVYIPKAKGGKRPLGIPSIEDKLVQGIIKSILEAIYESKFSDRSHGFRKERSCHTALIQIKKTFNSAKWFIEGDIKGFFDNIDHQILINILRKHINDEKFIVLIQKFLKAGYLEDWKFHKTYSGTPQGGIISPILSNIYLNEFDKYMEEYKSKFDKGEKRKADREYSKLGSRKSARVKALEKNRYKMTKEEITKRLDGIREVREMMDQLTPTDPMDKAFRRLQYVRYADDFIISVIGSKEEAGNIKADITNFLKEKLNLELSQEKTLITHHDKFARFLGYDIATEKREKVLYLENGFRTFKKGHIVLYVPKEVWVNKLKNLGALNLKSMTGEWQGKSRSNMRNLDDLEIISIFNAEIRGLYNYYKLAKNVSVLNKFHWIMEQSFLKTLAGKYKTSKQKAFKKYSFEGEIGVKYKTKTGEKIMLFHEKSYKRQGTPNTYYKVDNIEETVKIFGASTSLAERLRAKKCEWCGTENVPLEMHHVRKLKNLKGKAKWEKHMIARKRKTLAMCIPCHKKLHSGRLD